MKVRMIAFLSTLLVATLWSPAGHADDAVCVDIREMIVGNTYVAKEPLYDTKVDNHGIVDLERDKQEIPVGAQFKVLKVECDGGKLEIKLREVAPKKKEAVDIVFRLSKAERQMPDAMEQFQTMMAYVWEDVPAGK
jgi:hypothetical protein